jgi:DNA-nicking Smr family endonuclease
VAERRLSPDESALWARVMATVRPMAARPAPKNRPEQPPVPADPLAPARKPAGRVPPPRPAPAAPVTQRPVAQDATLDGGWDRRLSRGMIQPDATVDLHGHTLASAHGLLDGALERSIARGDRIILLITGKPPRPESERPHARGAIRAAVGDWLHASRHADSIAAVRGASPRHGGSGALYIVLRRPRPARKS